jgi:hypothetical protein
VTAAPLDDAAQALADAEANAPDLSGLPEWTLIDPFGIQLESVTNPPLKGGSALNAIAQACSDDGIDPLACLANVLHEGAGGGIGDNGTAFGPGQIHALDGRLPQFDQAAKNSPVVNAWAWSKNGIDYMVRSMASGKPSAKGLTGHAAVAAIVYGFEKPGDEAGAYLIRAAEYDHLVALSSGWASYVAAKLAGPVAGGATDTGLGAAAGTTAKGYVPAGVNAQWRGVVDVFGTDVPKARDAVRSFGLSLPGVFK